MKLSDKVFFSTLKKERNNLRRLSQIAAERQLFSLVDSLNETVKNMDEIESVLNLTEPHYEEDEYMVQKNQGTGIRHWQSKLKELFVANCYSDEHADSIVNSSEAHQAYQSQMSPKVYFENVTYSQKQKS